MSNDLKDANLALLIGIKRHLDETERLRKLYDHLLSLAKPAPSVAAAHSPRPEARHER